MVIMFEFSNFFHKHADTWPNMFVLIRLYIYSLFFIESFYFFQKKLIFFIYAIQFALAVLTFFFENVFLHQQNISCWFNVVYLLHNDGMVFMFRTLKAFGLKWFLVCASHIYEKGLTQFFTFASVEHQSIMCTIGGQNIFFWSYVRRWNLQVALWSIDWVQKTYIHQYWRNESEIFYDQSINQVLYQKKKRNEDRIQTAKW